MSPESCSRNSPSLSYSETSMFSSFPSQQDLLPELWLQAAPQSSSPSAIPQQIVNQHIGNYNYNNYNNYSYSLSNQPMNQYNSHPFNDNAAYGGWNDQRRNIAPPPGLTATAVLRDSSMEYAESLIPHSLLMPLTQENLDYHKATKELFSEIFTFDTQEHELPLMKKGRNGSVSSSTSSSDLSAQSGTSGCSKSTKATTKSLNTQLYKTELCMSFMKTNVCPYGNKCQFAHGEAELKRVERPSNWRSKPCANWTRYGSCRYGKRCCFKHGE